jgi:hypothetical protein
MNVGEPSDTALGPRDPVLQRSTATVPHQPDEPDPVTIVDLRRGPHAAVLPISGGQGVAGSNPAVPTVIRPGQSLACLGEWALTFIRWSPKRRSLTLLTFGLGRYCSSRGAPRENACGAHVGVHPRAVGRIAASSVVDVEV